MSDSLCFILHSLAIYYANKIQCVHHRKQKKLRLKKKF
jgi:hypothetical protein